MDKKEISGRMDKTLGALQAEFATVRAGRANPGVLESISVDYYGTATPISQIATIAVPDPRTISIQPWESNLLKEIERSIQASDLGINPTNDGKVIRLAFPPLTEERRKELVKQVKGYEENGKVAIRNIRRDYSEKFKAQKKKSEITEDDLKDYEKDLQKLTDDYIKKIEDLTSAKEKELYAI
ncbi:MAG: ribosome recycling factor [Oscillospiraceae bacterium]|jgi:ribosome recycling factor|nr:ribosome recycling factor [Oscillospiraceae bacterium]